MTKQIAKILTDGYTGARSEFQYIPPGEYELTNKTDLGNGKLKRALGEYIASIGKADVVAYVEPKPASKTRKRHKQTTKDTAND